MKIVFAALLMLIAASPRSITLHLDDGRTQTITLQPATLPTTQPADLPTFTVSIAQAGLATFFDGRPCLPDDQRTSYDWSWDFGDGSAGLAGFNSAHIYEKPGTYRATLTLAPWSGGAPRVFHQSVTIAPSTRQVVNVVAGTDLTTFSGRKDIELVLSPGTYTLSGTLTLGVGSVLMGNGAVLDCRAPNYAVNMSGGGRVDGVVFDYPAAANPADASYGPTAIAVYPMGKNNAVTGCTFLNVADACNGNANPDGVYFAGNKCPLATGVRGYMCWVQGGAWVITGNSFANSTVNHAIRCEANAGPLAVVANTLVNLSATQSGVNGDTSKGCILLHWTHDAYLAGNSITGQSVNGGGDVGVGPLRYDGNPGNPERVVRTVVVGNTFIGANLGVDAGAVDCVICGNQFTIKPLVTWPINAAIVVHATDAGRGRDVEKLVIENNTADAKYRKLAIYDGTADRLVSDWAAP